MISQTDLYELPRPRIIVSTRPDGGVTVTSPARDTMYFLMHHGVPDWYFEGPLDRDWEIDKFIRDRDWHPHLPNAARERLAARWIDALMSGGLSEAEAYEVIRDKDCRDEWTGHEVWGPWEVPGDRWFRDAWRRSHNGGPIDIDLDAARRIQATRLTELGGRARKLIRNDRQMERLLGRRDQVIRFMAGLDELRDGRRFRRRLERAKNEWEVKWVWPRMTGMIVETLS